MIKTAVGLLASQWKITLFSVVIIALFVALGLMAWSENMWFFLLVFLYVALDVYYGYLIHLGKALKGEEIEKPYKSIFFSKDKKRLNLIIFLALVAAVSFVLNNVVFPIGVFIIVMLAKLISSGDNLGMSLMAGFGLVSGLIMVAYQLIIWSSFSSLAYHRGDVAKSFGTGLKWFWKFKYILLVMLAGEVVFLVQEQFPSDIIAGLLGLAVLLFVPAAMILMICGYHLAEGPPPVPVAAEPAPASETAPVAPEDAG